MMDITESAEQKAWKENIDVYREKQAKPRSAHTDPEDIIEFVMPVYRTAEQAEIIRKYRETHPAKAWNKIYRAKQQTNSRIKKAFLALYPLGNGGLSWIDAGNFAAFAAGWDACNQDRKLPMAELELLESIPTTWVSVRKIREIPTELLARLLTAGLIEGKHNGRWFSVRKTAAGEALHTQQWYRGTMSYAAALYYINYAREV